MLNFFQDASEIFAAMSERNDGSMKLYPDNNLSHENRAAFFHAKAIETDSVVAAEIVHGINVELVDEKSTRLIKGADGLVTKSKSLFLSVTVADCIPVFAYEPKAKIIGIAHCGWRGIVDGIAESLVKKVLGTGGKVENIKVAMGPGINKCHFEIGRDVLERFKNNSEFIVKKDGKFFVDLKGIIKKQLHALGIRPENIEDNTDCTMENKEKYFSFRRDKPGRIEAMLAVVGIK